MWTEKACDGKVAACTGGLGNKDKSFLGISGAAKTRLLRGMMAIFNWQTCVVLSGQAILSWVFTLLSIQMILPNLTKKREVIEFFGLVCYFFSGANVPIC